MNPNKITSGITALIILSVVGTSFLFNSCTTPVPTTEAERIAQLTEQLNKVVADTNSGITARIAEANVKLENAKTQVLQFETCIQQNNDAMNNNSKISLQSFSSGGLQTAIDCDHLQGNTYDTPTITTSTGTATGAINPVPKRQLKPAELFYTTAVYDNCHVSQTEEQHFQKKNGGMLAIDVACRFGQPKAQRAVVYAPDYIGESRTYSVSKIGNDKLLGDYVELSMCEGADISVCLSATKWIIAHIETKKKVGDIVQTGEVLGQHNLSGVTTGYHTHIELWKLVDEKWTNVSYSTRSVALTNRRQDKLDTTVKISQPIYATQYNLGDVNQNDASPFIGASGKDLRHVKNPMALTSDIRKLYGIKFGDKVTLSGPCPGTYQVEDEMNIRFRSSCINKQGACIKADIAIQPGEQKNCSGVYSIAKL